jgi:hypothetical protein
MAYERMQTNRLISRILVIFKNLRLGAELFGEFCNYLIKALNFYLKSGQHRKDAYMTNTPFAEKPQTIFPAARSVKPYELEFSLFFIVVLSGVYIAYEILTEAKGSHPFGHMLGIFGTLLMLMTEVLYSLRKRSSLLNWAGPVRYWLSFHIFTGILGPFLVLMHTGLEFRGLAGISMLLTLLVVGSGFFGRYLYTALPRTLSGVSLSRQEILAEIARIEQDLAEFEAQKSDYLEQSLANLARQTKRRSPILMIIGRGIYQWQHRQKISQIVRKLDQLEGTQRQKLSQLLNKKSDMERQIDTLETVRSLLRGWHILHVPIGLTLFFSVAIHVFATLYFRAGLF